MSNSPISHITIGTNNQIAAAEFYDKVLGSLGFDRLVKPVGKPPAYAKGDQAPYIYLYEPFDGEKATVGNGCHIAFVAETSDQVDYFHELALKFGGNDEGAPGLRPQYGDNYYAAYIRDLDGNKLQAVCFLSK